jgi:protein-tyrosine phosphatase
MRVKYREEPDPGSGWDEIVPGLSMGGHVRQGPAGDLVPVVVGAEFDVVISLYHREGHAPPGAVVHHCREIPDGPLTAAQLADASEMAEVAAASVRGGRSVLVRCRSGYNRSGLVVAQALVHLGFQADDAIALVRRRRSKWALNNRLFVEYLATGLDVAGLLASLDG